MPASFSRATIHGGVGRVGSMPRTMRVAKTADADAAADRRLVADLDGEAVARGIHGARLLAGSRNAAPVAWAYSRATPRIENA